MHLETKADLAKLASRNPRVLARYERMKRAARRREKIDAQMAEAIARFKEATPIPMRGRPPKKLTRKAPADQNATNAAAIASRKSRSYTYEADSRGVAATTERKACRPGPRPPRAKRAK